MQAAGKIGVAGRTAFLFKRDYTERGIFALYI